MKPDPGKTDAEKRAYYKWLAGQVSNLLPEKSGSRNRFAMIVFSEGGKPQFVGRGNRIEAIRALREMAYRLERKEVAEVASLFPVNNTPDPSTVATSPIPVPCLPSPSDPEGWDSLRPNDD